MAHALRWAVARHEMQNRFDDPEFMQICDEFESLIKARANDETRLPVQIGFA